jgi:uncharacterized repeat protein (TIGR01451 family)
MSALAPALFAAGILPNPAVRAGFGKGSGRSLSCKLWAGLFLTVALAAMVFAGAAFAATARIDNIAKAVYMVGAQAVETDSNPVSIMVRTPSTIEFLEYAPLAPGAEEVNIPPTSYLLAGSFVPVSAPVVVGSTTPLDLTRPVPLMVTELFHENEPIFIRLTDYDQNLDPLVAETVLVTLTLPGSNEREVLLLTESGPDTGKFTGQIQSIVGTVVVGNGQLTVNQGSQIQADYTDPVDGTDTSVTAALVDPYGMVFDSITGLPIDGALVTLIDATTGLPATVFGDDGISSFPASLLSGGTAADSSGRVYTLRPGFYRFPFIQPGRYILNVVPPSTHRAPSQVATADLQNLPGAPFAIVDPGSRGEEFVLNPGPAIHIDIPLDPLAVALHLSKTTSKEVVAIGDFLQYQIDVENVDLLSSLLAATGILVNDRLPLGFRYRKGSTRINGIAAADPLVSGDGRTMTFNVGTVAAGDTATITYVLEVASGARVGAAENIAVATGDGALTSNVGRAVVLVKEDLFGSKVTIMGRVFPEGCEDDGQEREGLAGVRIYLEDGTYAVTDRNGMYHFEGVKPGSHVVQLDQETLPDDYLLSDCEENDRFAGTPYAQFVDLQGGTMWRADFYTTPQPPVIIEAGVGIELSSVLEQNAQGSDSVKYTIDIDLGEIPVTNLRLTMMLPDNTEYQAGSSVYAGSTLPDPAVTGNTMTYRLSDVEAGYHGQVRLIAKVPKDAKDGELIAKALLTFKNLRTPLADNILKKRSEVQRQVNPDYTLRPLFAEFGYTLGAADKVALDEIIADLQKVSVTHLFLVGHTNSTRIAPRSRHIMADNYELSKARAKSVADYFVAKLGLREDQITSSGKGPDEPIASNETSEGRALNRRVELRVLSEKVLRTTELKNIKDRSGLQDVEFTAVKVPAKSAVEQAREERLKKRTLPEFNSVWLNKAEPGLALVWPYVDFHPDIPTVKIAVKHTPDRTLKLFANGAEVEPIYLDGTTRRIDNEIAVSLWIGIGVNGGDNLFAAVEYDAEGMEEKRIEWTIHYSTPPVSVELVPELSRLIADGMTPSVIAVRFTDKDGHPARAGSIGEYSLAPPYQPLKKLEDLQHTPLTASKENGLRYVLGEDGIALIELQPTSQAGAATVKFKLADGDHELRTWLTPGERDWIMVGLAEGTAGYNSVAGNMENLGDYGDDAGYYEEGRLAFFAKGMIKGKWLLTAAYDTDKNGIRQNDSLYGTIDPDQYYTLYGDGAEQQYDAASGRSLYLKIERDKFYAVFGDFSTGLSVTELSRYNRSLNGIKSEMKGEKYDFNVFVSDTNQAFVKDELRGDGTSGLYHLSRRDIVLNSETITIQARDRFRSEVIISSETLRRHLDYDIDYEAGTIFFKRPIFSRDENFNPIYIVVDYESFDKSDMSFNYGGRGAARLLDNKLEIGATHIHEGRTGGEGNLFGVDATLALTEATTVRAEIAATATDFNGVGASGTAYLTELSYSATPVTGKAYLREQESTFGLGQQMGSETGTRKIGVSGSYQLTEKINFMGDVFRNYNLGTDGVRDVADLQALLNENDYSLHTGVRHAQDNLGHGEVNSSEQLTVGGAYNLLDDKLIVRADHDQSLGGSNENSDYPTRTILGADYRLGESATLFVAQEFTFGELENSQTSRLGLKGSPWEGGQLSSTVERQYTESGARVFSVTGLQQTWQVTKKWTVDAGLDRSDTIHKPGNTPFNANVPAASGSTTDFMAISAGAGYSEEKWAWTGRLENRTSDNEDKLGLTSGIYGEFNEGLGLSAGLQLFKTESAVGPEKLNLVLRLAMAHRPKMSKWIILDRLDFLIDRQKSSPLDYNNWRIINNLNANYRHDEKTEVSLQYAVKYGNETIDGNSYSCVTDLLGLEGRYDITRDWDIGLRGSALHSWEAGQVRYGTGISVGHDLVKNLWLSLGYNFIGFTDEDFANAEYTAQGPFVKLRMKFDQGSVQDAVKLFSGQ